MTIAKPVSYFHIVLFYLFFLNGGRIISIKILNTVTVVLHTEGCLGKQTLNYLELKMYLNGIHLLIYLEENILQCYEKGTQDSFPITVKDHWTLIT